MSNRRLALTATLHCLTGCAIGEVLGLAIGTGLHWGNGSTLALVVAGGAAYPVNLWLIGRGRGPAVAHAGHGGH